VEQSDSDDSSPSIQTKPTKPKPTKKPRGSRKATGKQQPARPETPQPRTNQGTTNQEQNEEAENDEYKWWEENKDDNSQKWTTLEVSLVLLRFEYSSKKAHLAPTSSHIPSS
jgi:DNA topoisomerase-1